jgi:alpha-tubulin suppressor-like RCC1 family protein
LPEDFFPRDKTDEIIDISAGRHFTVIVTKSGKVYGSGMQLYDELTDCRHNEEDDSSKPFEIKMPEGHKAFEAYSCERYYNIWINAKDGEGKT